MIGRCVECGSTAPGDPEMRWPPWKVCPTCGRAWGAGVDGETYAWWVEERSGLFSIWENQAASETVPFVAVDVFETRGEALTYLERALMEYVPLLKQGPK